MNESKENIDHFNYLSLSPKNKDNFKAKFCEKNNNFKEKLNKIINDCSQK